ncbi:hypothetical protein CHU98_g5848 [Xylaria longipes]|nr:hypothetical protein CHU98_g5848 [Xylaria longipes]
MVTVALAFSLLNLIPPVASKGDASISTLSPLENGTHVMGSELTNSAKSPSLTICYGLNREHITAGIKAPTLITFYFYKGRWLIQTSQSFSTPQCKSKSAKLKPLTSSSTNRNAATATQRSRDHDPVTQLLYFVDFSGDRLVISPPYGVLQPIHKLQLQ